MSRESKLWLGAVLLALGVLIGLLTLQARASSCITSGDLQTQLDARGATTICVRGVFHGTVRPKQGQTITGGHLVGTYDLRAGNVTLRGVEVSGSDIGVVVGLRSRIVNSYIHDTTQNGIHGYAQGADWWVEIIGNRLVDNGTAALEGHAAAGIKLLALSRPNHDLGAGATILDNTVLGSHGNGIWLDQSSNSSVIANNLVRDSTRHGIRLEIAGGLNVVRHNTIRGSGFDGIDVTSNGIAHVLNNTVTTSHDWGITVHTDGRAQKTWADYGDPHVGWYLHRITMRGNSVDGTYGCHLEAVVCHG